MSLIGHNRGPSMAPGAGFRKVAWTKARAALLPRLPLEVVRLRVARAKRLGLPYQTYATIRAVSGRDIVAFLFSGNALEVTPRRVRVGEDMANRLRALDGAAGRGAAVYRPVSPEAVAAANSGLFEIVGAAPDFTAPWPAQRAAVGALVREAGWPRDGVVLVAATTIERDWAVAAGLASTIGPDGFSAPEMPNAVNRT